MNKFYVIFPLVGLIAFAVYFSSFHTKYEEKVAAQKAAAEEKKAADEAERKRREDEAAKEAQANLEQQRLAAEKKKADERAKQKAKDDEVNAQIDQFQKEFEALSVDLGKQQAQLAEMRRKRSQLQDEAFDLQHDIERMNIDRRTAENEIQRATQMLADRIGASSLADATMFANPTPPSKRPSDQGK